jgi:hypothetical protein
MSDQPKTEEKKEDGEATKLLEEEEEDQGYSCGSCWNGYCACVVWTCKVLLYLLLCIVCLQYHSRY